MERLSLAERSLVLECMEKLEELMRASLPPSPSPSPEGLIPVSPRSFSPEGCCYDVKPFTGESLTEPCRTPPLSAMTSSKSLMPSMTSTTPPIASSSPTRESSLSTEYKHKSHDNVVKDS